MACKVPAAKFSLWAFTVIDASHVFFINWLNAVCECEKGYDGDRNDVL